MSGLPAGGQIVLQNNGTDALTVSGNGNFTFATALVDGSPYAVSVQSHQPGISCSVNNGSGAVNNIDITSVVVSCAAGTQRVLYSFGGGADGASPMSDLVMDGGGNLYGTTSAGGVNNQGTVFRVAAGGGETVLHSFGAGNDGQQPASRLVMDGSGNLFGTTFKGGNNQFGTVFELTPAGAESVLYSFASSDGAFPAAGLLLDPAGALDGTTFSGGTSGGGTVFKMTTAGHKTFSYSFMASGDGYAPPSPLVMDGSGNLYGTTRYGGANGGGLNGLGTVFKITPAGAESVLYAFAGGNDGANPVAGVVLDSAGNLYGTTVFGGTAGVGTVFKITPAGVHSVLYSFAGGSDGGNPFGGLLLDSAGNLYGTTSAGGSHNAGTVFKLTPQGVESLLYTFSGSDGQSPTGGLLMDSTGNVYGTTQLGGSSGAGTVFTID